MHSSIVDCVYITCDIKTLLNLRTLSKEWKLYVDMLCRTSKCVPDHWQSYMNVYGLSELFPNVEYFNNVGHRGHVFNDLKKVSKLWLDSPLSTFSIIVCNLSTVNVKELILKLDNTLALLNVVSSIKWNNLEKLNVITEFEHEEVKILNWKTPKIRSLMIGSPFCHIPTCTSSLPINLCTELYIANSLVNRCDDITKWFSNFLDTWKYFSINNKIKKLHLYNVVPECELCISTLIQILNVLNIEECHLNPCSSDTCVFILTHTRVVLHLEEKNTHSWKNIYIAFSNRIVYKKSV